MLTPHQARRVLMSLRTAVGWSSMVAPRLLLRIFGVNPTEQPSLVYILRLFGIRDILMAYQLYQAQTIHSSAEEMEEALRQGIAVDGIDVVSAVLAGAKGGVPARTAVLSAGTAAAAVGLGYLGRDPEGPSTVERNS